jgi:hypothetical protein
VVKKNKKKEEVKKDLNLKIKIMKAPMLASTIKFKRSLRILQSRKVTCISKDNQVKELGQVKVLLED